MRKNRPHAAATGWEARVCFVSGDFGQRLLGDFLSSGDEWADFVDVRGLGGLPAGVGIHLGVENHGVDVFARRKDVIPTANAEVIGPAGAA